jgi:hypothetical protein
LRLKVFRDAVQSVMVVTDASNSFWQRGRVSGIAYQGPLRPCVTNLLSNTLQSRRFAQAALKQCGWLE